jgi:hypothetical protein
MLHFLFVWAFAIVAHELGHEAAARFSGCRLKHVSLFCKEYEMNPSWYNKPQFRIGMYWFGFNPLVGGGCSYTEALGISMSRALLIDTAGILVNATLALLGWWLNDWMLVAVNLFFIGAANGDVKEALSKVFGWPSISGAVLLFARGLIMVPLVWAAWSDEWSWHTTLAIVGCVMCIQYFTELVRDMRDTGRLEGRATFWNWRI